MERLKRLLRRQRPDPVPVVLYSRPGCHLCEDARARLDRISDRTPLAIIEVDITTDPDLVRRYDILIPVIRVGDHTELSAPISEDELRRAVHEAVLPS